MSANPTKITKRAGKIIALHNSLQSMYLNAGQSVTPKRRGSRYAILDAKQAIDGAGLHPREEDAVAFLEAYCDQMRKQISKIERVLLT